jgi:CubicO group peptidase (beta-lactamase class C family)
VDRAAIEAIHRDFSSGAYGNIDRFLLIRHGQVIADERYEHDYVSINAGQDPTLHPYNYYHPDWHPYYRDSGLHTLQSVTKGITSLLIGIAIQRGDLPGTDARVVDFFEDYQIENLDEDKRTMTIEDLLTMRSGLDWDEWSYAYDDPRNTCAQMEKSQDWIQFVLDRPMANEPGQVFVYNSGASQLLSAIVKEASGLAVDEYAEAHLFGPLGIAQYHWKATPKGWPDTEGGLYLKAEGLAKIGYLILHDGVWDGEQVVPEAWVEQSTSWRVGVFPSDPALKMGYGYQWWQIGGSSTRLPRTVVAAGYGGQYLFVAPELDLVLVLNGWNIYDSQPSIFDLYADRIVPAARNDSVPDPPREAQP